MIAYDVATKLLDTESFSQRNFAGLISGITFIVLLSQEKPLRWKEIHTRARARARAHTHTHNHSKPSIFSKKRSLSKVFW